MILLEVHFTGDLESETYQATSQASFSKIIDKIGCLFRTNELYLAITLFFSVH